MKRHLRAWAMRFFSLTTAEYATFLREQNEELDDMVSRLRADLDESDATCERLWAQVNDCRKNHWRVLVKYAMDDIKKMEANGGTR